MTWPKKYAIGPVIKEVVGEIRPNKTPKAMTRASKAAAGLQQMVQRMSNTLH